MGYPNFNFQILKRGLVYSINFAYSTEEEGVKTVIVLSTHTGLQTWVVLVKACSTLDSPQLASQYFYECVLLSRDKY